MKKITYAIVIPTKNAGELWRACVEGILKQSYRPLQVLVIDSCSTDDTAIYARECGFSLLEIDAATFNHGGTRNIGARAFGCVDVVLFLTQDAILTDEYCIERLLMSFDDPEVGAVCGCQIPHLDANPLAAHARKFNYSETSIVKSKEDICTFGLKTAFMSNSFAAYRCNVFDMLGGFPENTILAEDMFLTAKMILAGHKIAYCAEAAVRHSHNYTPWEEFRRYFDTGVFHACEPWIQSQLGAASGEGLRFVKSELYYLWQHAPLWIPRALVTIGCKLLGYKLGKNYRKLPKSWRPKFSMYKSYWLQQDE